MRLLDRPHEMLAPDFWPVMTLLAATVLLEAEGEPADGQLAVAYSPCNRMRDWGVTLQQAILGKDGRAYDDGHPFEPYSCWNDDYRSAARHRLKNIADAEWHYFYRLACAAYWRFLPDPSGEADHYLNIELTRKIRGGSLPSWYDESKITAVHGRHTFLKLR